MNGIMITYLRVLLGLAIPEAGILLVQTGLYFGCEYFQHDFHDVHRPIDDRVPCIPVWTLAYCLWFPLIAVFPLGLYFVSRQGYIMYQAAILFSMIVSTLCYLIYPTTFTRDPAPDTFWGRMLAIVYKCSYRGVNCAPSLHCWQCYTVILAAVISGGPWWFVLPSVAIAAAVVIATQLTKQHVLIDALSALPFAVIGILLGLAVSAGGAAGELLAGIGL